MVSRLPTLQESVWFCGSSAPFDVSSQGRTLVEETENAYFSLIEIDEARSLAARGIQIDFAMILLFDRVPSLDMSVSLNFKERFV